MASQTDEDLQKNENKNTEDTQDHFSFASSILRKAMDEIENNVFNEIKMAKERAWEEIRLLKEKKKSLKEEIKKKQQFLQIADNRLNQTGLKIFQVAKESNSQVKLNIGGRKFVTSKQTLTREESMLSAMFSGKFDVQPDEEGEYFIDRNGTHFEIILDFLRTGKVILEGLTARDLQQLSEEVDFYQIQGMSDVLNGTESKKGPKKWKWDRKAIIDKITIIGNTAHSNASGYASVRTIEPILPGETCSIYLDFLDSEWSWDVGISTNGFDPKKNDLYSRCSSQSMRFKGRPKGCLVELRAHEDRVDIVSNDVCKSVPCYNQQQVVDYYPTVSFYGRGESVLK